MRPVRPLAPAALAALLAAGCGGEKADVPPVPSVTPQVRLAKPEHRNLVRVVSQPSFVEAYEQTSVFAKLAGYVKEWKVDIGDKVKKGDLLCTLFIPELVEEQQKTQSQVSLDAVMVEQAERLVDVATGNLKAAVATVAEARANVGKYQAEVDRWSSEVTRLTSLADQKVVDNQVLSESQRQLKSNTASRDAANAGVLTADANRLARDADLAKAKVDVAAAKAKLEVSKADNRRLTALVGYTTLASPYDGVVVARNVNTGDFVLPATGDPSTGMRAPDLSPSKAAPLYVIARTDVVRVYVDVPEADANSVSKGTKATVRVQAFRDAEMPAEVTRTSWALNVRSRTLRAEIDLKNPDSKLLPGMYAYGKVVIDRPNALCLPLAAVTKVGDATVCYVYRDGKAARTPVQVGMKDDKYVEVVGKQQKPSSGADDPAWTAFDGTEQVILGELDELTDGEAVEVEKAG